jgi:uncharacterized membrane protein YoaK (UPF0700 family)
MEITEIPRDRLLHGVRHVLALGIVAGFVDAMSIIDFKGFAVGAMTGNTVQLGILFTRQHWALFSLVAAAVTAYTCGAMISSALRRHSHGSVIGLSIMSLLLIGVLVVRLFTPLSRVIEFPMLALAMSLQAESVSHFGGVPMQTVVATGALLQFADGAVGRLFHSASLAEVVIPAVTWLAYVGGAGVGAISNGSFPRWAFIIPIFLILLSVCDYSRHRRADRIRSRRPVTGS